MSKLDILALQGARELVLPPFVEPSSAVSVAEPPRTGNWIHEIKPASEVVLEQSQEVVPQHKSSATHANLEFTNKDRKLWDGEGVTKQALGDVCSNIAGWSLPLGHGRLLSLVRCPDETAGKCYSAKHGCMGLAETIQFFDTDVSQLWQGMTSVD